MRVSSLVKHRTLLLDRSKYDASKLDGQEAGADYMAACRMMAAQRPPPMSPDEVARELRQRSDASHEHHLSFSFADDLEPVIDLYRRGERSGHSRVKHEAFHGSIPCLSFCTHGVRHCNYRVRASN